MPNVMAGLPNTSGALCSTPQFGCEDAQVAIFGIIFGSCISSGPRAAHFRLPF